MRRILTSLTLVIAVLHALTTTTSSAELIKSLARPREGRADAMLCRAEVIVQRSWARMSRYAAM